MNIKAGRKNISCLAALLIVFFHLWILVTKSPIESFLKVASYIGVDLFFFLSAFSLSLSEIKDYWSFVKKRFVKVYSKFIIFAIITAIYKKWKLVKLLQVVTMIEFFNRGGGSYLWFVPAIMLFYILFPLYRKLADKKPVMVSVITLAIWFVVTYLLTATKTALQLMIFLNRIPVLLAGYLACKVAKKTPSKLTGVILLVIGLVLVYFTGANQKLNSPIYNLYYVCAIPLTLAIVILLADVKSNKLTGYIGSITLEMYAVQMSFGYNIAESFYKLTKTPLISNILTFVAVIIISGLFNYLFEFITNKLSSKKVA